MKLSEPAATLWRKHHAAIERIAIEEDAESRLLIGGGTVLAARWEHRESTDIDVFLPERENRGLQQRQAGDNRAARR